MVNELVWRVQGKVKFTVWLVPRWGPSPPCTAPSNQPRQNDQFTSFTAFLYKYPCLFEFYLAIVRCIISFSPLTNTWPPVHPLITTVVSWRHKTRDWCCMFAVPVKSEATDDSYKRINMVRGVVVGGSGVEGQCCAWSICLAKQSLVGWMAAKMWGWSGGPLCGRLAPAIVQSYCYVHTWFGGRLTDYHGHIYRDFSHNLAVIGFYIMNGCFSLVSYTFLKNG